MHKRILLKALLPLALGVSACAAQAQGWPNKPVRVIIPFPPGGTLDTVGRTLAQKLSEQTGQSFVVENKPGGNGTIGADAVAKAPADGYTLLFNASTFTTAPMTMKSVPYSVVNNFTPVALVAKAPLSVTSTGTVRPPPALRVWAEWISGTWGSSTNGTRQRDRAQRAFSQ